MSWQATQRKLNGFGYQLSVDGILGPRTLGALFSFMGAKDTASAFGIAAYYHFPDAAISTPLRVAHFLAQASYETTGFRYLVETWGPTPAQLAYEGNPKLGNTEPGDGYKFRGRGIFQLTGRANYERYGERMALDLVDNPNLAAQPDTAVHIACLYWSDLNLNQFADRNDARAVGNGINRGNPGSSRMPNGYSGRLASLAHAKQVLS